MNIGDRVQTINTLCPISGTILEIYNSLIVISDDDAETDDDRLEFHIDDLEVVQWKNSPNNKLLKYALMQIHLKRLQTTHVVPIHGQLLKLLFQKSQNETWINTH